MTHPSHVFTRVVFLQSIFDFLGPHPRNDLLHSLSHTKSGKLGEQQDILREIICTLRLINKDSKDAVENYCHYLWIAVAHWYHNVLRQRGNRGCITSSMMLHRALFAGGGAGSVWFVRALARQGEFDVRAVLVGKSLYRDDDDADDAVRRVIGTRRAAFPSLSRDTSSASATAVNPSRDMLPIMHALALAPPAVGAPMISALKEAFGQLFAPLFLSCPPVDGASALAVAVWCCAHIWWPRQMDSAFDTVRALLESGADPNQAEDPSGMPLLNALCLSDNTSRSALQESHRTTCFAVATEVDRLRTSGSEFFGAACVPLVRLLLEFGSDPDRRGDKGYGASALEAVAGEYSGLHHSNRTKNAVAAAALAAWGPPLLETMALLHHAGADICSQRPLEYGKHFQSLHKSVLQTLAGCEAAEAIARLLRLELQAVREWALTPRKAARAAERAEQVLEWMLLRWESTGDSALLMAAARDGGGDVVRVLVEYWGHFAALLVDKNDKNDFSLSRLLEQRNNTGGTALHTAVAWQALRPVEVLCVAGADVGAQVSGGNDTAFHIAARAGSVDLLRLLIEHLPKEDRATRSSIVEMKNRQKETALVIACSASSLPRANFARDALAMVKLLLVDAHADANNAFALHHAAKQIHGVELIMLIVQLGNADVNLVDDAGRSALHVAALFHREETCKFLIEECKCDTTVRDEEGQTARDVLVAKSNVGEHSSFLKLFD